MSTLLTKITTYLLGGRSMLGVDNLPESWGWVKKIVSAIDTLLYPLLIVVGAAGMIYAVVIGVQMARADSTEKREEAKKRLINVIVGLAITIALILFFKLFINSILPAFIPAPEEDPTATAMIRW